MQVNKFPELKAFILQLLFFIVISILIFTTRAHAKDLRVLFIGNSYTYVNDLPMLIGNLAVSTGDQLTYSSSAPGGFTFQQHSVNPATIDLIEQGNWDYVVLQEQSQRPAFPDAQVEEDVYPFARKLDSLVKVHNPCARTVFYMTWGRKNGDQDNCGFFPPLCTYEGMDDLLQLRYTIMADSNNAIISPVAKVWRRLRTNNPGMELYDADQSHPSLKGSYAAACAFYSVLFGKDPAGCTFNSSLSSADAGIIKNAAKAVAFDSLDSWYAYSPAVQAGFTHTISGSTVSFTNGSSNAVSYTWYFDDGDTSQQKNPAHTYTAVGTYQVKLVAHRCTETDTVINPVTITTVGVDDVVKHMGVAVYPNPAKDMLYVKSDKPVSGFRVFDAMGREVYGLVLDKGNVSVINIGQLSPGLYHLVLLSGSGASRHRFMKQ